MCITAALVAECRVIRHVQEAHHDWALPCISCFLLPHLQLIPAHTSHHQNSCFLFPFLLSPNVPQSFVLLERPLDMAGMFVIASCEARAGSLAGQTTSAHCRITLSVIIYHSYRFSCPTASPPCSYAALALTHSLMAGKRVHWSSSCIKFFCFKRTKTSTMLL